MEGRVLKPSLAIRGRLAAPENISGGRRMCAICGILNFNHSDRVDRTMEEKMTRRLIHRDPDDEGFFAEGQAGLGFRRLSIIDRHSHFIDENAQRRRAA
jgi:hypothetical protein